MSEITRVLCSKSDLNGLISRLKSSGVTYMLGHNSIYVQKYRLKLIDSKAAIEHPDVNGVIVPMTAGEIARVEMRRLWPNVRRVGWRRDVMPLLDARWPMAYIQNYAGPLVYIDLVSAYAQLYKRLWLDVAWPCGFGMLDMFPLWEKVGQNKPARNAVIGTVRANGARMVYKGKLKTIPSNNAFLSPPLWATIQGLLNEIAQIALNCGAIYVMTDGYLLPAGEGSEAFEKILKGYGLTYRRKVDDKGVVSGWMSYKVADKATKIFRKGQKGGQRTFRSVNVPFQERTLKLISWWGYDIPRYREKRGMQW